jgi:hypothetical protein
MIRWIAPVLLSLFSVSLHAQAGLYVGGGYNLSFTNYKTVNSIIARYNETRPGLSKKMDRFNLLHGPAILFGVQMGKDSKYAANFDFGHYGNVVSSSYTNASGQINTTDLQLKTDMFSLSFGAFPEVWDKLKFGFGLSLFYGHYQFSLRSSEYAYTNPSTFTPVAEYSALGVAPMMQFFIGLTKNLFLHVKPYYNFDVTLSDIYELNKKLNPATYQQDRDLNYEQRFNNFGLYGGLAFSF